MIKRQKMKTLENYHYLSIIIVGYHLDINRGLALDYMKDEPIVIFYTTWTVK